MVQGTGEQERELGKDQALKGRGSQGGLGLWGVPGDPACPSPLLVCPVPCFSVSPCSSFPSTLRTVSLPQIPLIVYPSTYVPKSPPSTPAHGLLPVCSKTCTHTAPCPAPSRPFPSRAEPLTNYWPPPTGGLGGRPLRSAGGRRPGLTRAPLHGSPHSSSLGPGPGGGEASPP